MKLNMLTKLTFAIIAFGTFGLSSGQANPITITQGPANNQGTDNVLFNNNLQQHSGLLVQGDFNGGGSGFIVDFTSSSGNGMIMGSGGQATVNGLTGNNPFTSLSFGLEGGSTFTRAILNPDATAAGNIMFSVFYTMNGSPFMQTFNVSGNGQNFFSIDAGMGALINSITFSSNDTSFANASQFRLGGFARPGVPTVPDGGATLLLLGASMTAVELLRRTLLKRAPVA